VIDDKEQPYDGSEPVFAWRHKASESAHQDSHAIPLAPKPPDQFTRLPNEILSLILDCLSSQDIASLRLATPACRQLNMSLFRRLLLEDMPWLWEAEKLPKGKTDWHRLYKKVKFCGQNLKGLQNRRRIWKDVGEVVTRIGRCKKEGKIDL